MTTQKEAALTDEMVDRLNAAALPDPQDEREVMHAPLLREAAAAIVALEERVQQRDGQIARLLEQQTRLIDGRQAAERQLAEARAEIERLNKACDVYAGVAKIETEKRRAIEHFIDNNMTFYDVDADWPVEGHNIPALAQVSNRIWYHATDDITSYPFSKLIDATREQK